MCTLYNLMVIVLFSVTVKHKTVEFQAYCDNEDPERKAHR